MLSRSFMLDNFFLALLFPTHNYLLYERFKYYVNDNYERILFLSHLATSDDGRIKSLKFISPHPSAYAAALKFSHHKGSGPAFFIATIFFAYT
jgi:hypothetical protein